MNHCVSCHATVHGVVCPYCGGVAAPANSGLYAMYGQSRTKYSYPYASLGAALAKPLSAELAAEPLEGWRLWTIIRSTDGLDTREEMAAAYDRGENPWRAMQGPRLASFGRQSYWVPGVRMAARADGCGCAEPPGEACACGYWALPTRDAALARSWRTSNLRSSLVLGRVQLWGRVVVHTNGFRAQYARPMELFTFGEHPDGQRISELYGVPVTALPKAQA